MIQIDDLLEVRLKDPDDFLKVKETLTRIGVASKKSKSLFQSCHILHKQQRYFIVHFKELFALDGKPANISDQDMERKNTIAKLLSEWGLVEMVEMPTNLSPMSAVKVIPYRDKANWDLVSKYTIGRS